MNFAALMMLQIEFPKWIKPVFLELGPVQLRWYGLMYMISFVAGYFLLKRLVKLKKLALTTDDLYDLLFFLILGVMIGGRIGYVLFYDFSSYIQRPIEVLYIWQGGMSFHGGFIGVVLATLFLCWRRGWKFWEISDLVCAGFPIGLGLVRLGNFINGELYGRVTTLPWGVIFPAGGDMPRHPSQIYEAFFEGIVLFAILWFVRTRVRQPNGVLTGLFFIFYAIFRIVVENFREPDASLILGVTRGQFFSFFLIAIGLAFVIVARLRPSFPKKDFRA